MKRDRRRRGGLLPLSKIKLPSGGPARLYRLALLARLREAIGMPAGAALIDYRLSDEGLTLTLDDGALCRALASDEAVLARRLGEVVGRPGCALRWQVCESARRPRISEKAAAPAVKPGASPAERIRAVAKRIRETRALGRVPGSRRGVDTDAKRP